MVDNMMNMGEKDEFCSKVHYNFRSNLNFPDDLD